MTETGRTIFGVPGGGGVDVPSNPRTNAGEMGSGTLADIPAGTGATVLFDSAQGENGDGAPGLNCTTHGQSGPTVTEQGLYVFSVLAGAEQPFIVNANPGNNEGYGIHHDSFLNSSGSQEVCFEFITGLFPGDTISFGIFAPDSGATIVGATTWLVLKAWRLM